MITFLSTKSHAWTGPRLSFQPLWLVLLRSLCFSIIPTPEPSSPARGTSQVCTVLSDISISIQIGVVCCHLQGHLLPDFLSRASILPLQDANTPFSPPFFLNVALTALDGNGLLMCLFRLCEPPKAGVVTSFSGKLWHLARYLGRKRCSLKKQCMNK